MNIEGIEDVRAYWDDAAVIVHGLLRRRTTPTTTKVRTLVLKLRMVAVDEQWRCVMIGFARDEDDDGRGAGIIDNDVLAVGDAQITALTWFAAGWAAGHGAAYVSQEPF